jgi:hypothetical protein
VVVVDFDNKITRLKYVFNKTFKSRILGPSVDYSVERFDRINFCTAYSISAVARV